MPNKKPETKPFSSVLLLPKTGVVVPFAVPLKAETGKVWGSGPDWTQEFAQPLKIETKKPDFNVPFMQSNFFGVDQNNAEEQVIHEFQEKLAGTVKQIIGEQEEAHKKLFDKLEEDVWNVAVKPKAPECACETCQDAYKADYEAYKLQKKEKQQAKQVQNQYPDSESAKKFYQPSIKSMIDDSPAGKNGKWGGISSYDDKDVVEATKYMNEVLGVQSMEINGRSLAHILAEVRGFAIREAGEAQKKLAGVEFQRDLYKRSYDKQVSAILSYRAEGEVLKKTIVDLKQELSAERARPKYQVIEAETVPTHTGRRIKDDD